MCWIKMRYWEPCSNNARPFHSENIALSGLALLPSHSGDQRWWGMACAWFLPQGPESPQCCIELVLSFVHKLSRYPLRNFIQVICIQPGSVVSISDARNAWTSSNSIPLDLSLITYLSRHPPIELLLWSTQSTREADIGWLWYKRILSLYRESVHSHTLGTLTQSILPPWATHSFHKACY